MKDILDSASNREYLRTRAENMCVRESRWTGRSGIFSLNELDVMYFVPFRHANVAKKEGK